MIVSHLILIYYDDQRMLRWTMGVMSVDGSILCCSFEHYEAIEEQRQPLASIYIQ